MSPDDRIAVGRLRWLLWLGVALVAIGAALMDVAGRTRLAFWWDVSGGCAFLGFALTVAYLLQTEGLSSFWFGRKRGDRLK